MLCRSAEDHERTKTAPAVFPWDKYRKLGGVLHHFFMSAEDSDGQIEQT